MIENFPRSASDNIPLLEAIREGAATSPGDLAERAGVGGNLARKLNVLIEEGIVISTGEATHQVALTDVGEQALKANAVFRGEASAPEASDARAIPFSLIDPWPDQPRSAATISDAAIEEMAQSVADKGVLQPLTVRPHPADPSRYQVIIGERRRLGSARAVANGWLAADFTVPARLRHYSDEEAFEVAVAENTQREDLHWMDEARAFLRMSLNGRSPAEIERISGTRRKLRSVQDLIKIARELSAEMVARTYLPDDHKDQLKYVAARDKVGNKTERPALALSPKLTVALLEVIAAGMDADMAPEKGDLVVTRFHAAPVGGPLSTLQVDRKLIDFGFDRGDLVARTKITEDVYRWLGSLNYLDHQGAALFKARAAVVDEFRARELEREGRYLTAELNPPPKGEAPPADDADADDEETDELADRFNVYLEAKALVIAEQNASTSFVQRKLQLNYNTAAGFIERLEQEGVVGPADHTGKRAVLVAADDDAPPFEGWTQDGPGRATPPTPAVEPEAAHLPPMLAIVVLEVAHRISTAGVERGPGTWGTPVLANYYNDTRGAQLVQGHKMLAFLPMGQQTLVCLGKAGRDWLAETHGIEETNGKITMGDLRLQAAQEAMGFKPVGDGPYSSFWLNPPADAAAPSSSPRAEPVEGEVDHRASGETEGVSTQTPATSAAPTRDPFGAAIVSLAAETRALTRCVAALREARVAIGTAAYRKLKVGEVATLVALIDGAVEAAEPHLAEGA